MPQIVQTRLPELILRQPFRLLPNTIPTTRPACISSHTTLFFDQKWDHYAKNKCNTNTKHVLAAGGLRAHKYVIKKTIVGWSNITEEQASAKPSLDTHASAHENEIGCDNGLHRGAAGALVGSKTIDYTAAHLGRLEPGCSPPSSLLEQGKLVHR